MRVIAMSTYRAAKSVSAKGDVQALPIISMSEVAYFDFLLMVRIDLRSRWVEPLSSYKPLKLTEP